MKYLRFVALLGICLFFASFANAQRVFVGVGVGPGYYYGPAYYGPPPVCAYGYYDYYPYACAPYGYYGPQWFAGGVFIGAGPWFHGFHRRSFYGPRGFEGRFHGDFDRDGFRGRNRRGTRSEEHTSELQSRLHLVCRLLLEKKKQLRVSVL